MRALALAVVILSAGCGGPAAPAEPGRGKPLDRPRTSAEVSAALQLADKAYLAGDWGEAVVQANRVLEGAAAPDEYYAALRILGLASCNRKDPRPAGHAWSRLQPPDRQHLEATCRENGITLPGAP